MRYSLMLAIWLINCVPVAAQDSLTTFRPATAQTTAADTIAAIHRLFAARRRACTYVVGGTALVAGGSALNALLQPAPHGVGFSAGTDGLPLMAAFISIISGAVVGLELLTLGGWGARAEASTLESFKQHLLPMKMKRKLKPRYFQR